MTSKRYWLTTGAAVVAALGVGFGAAQLLKPPAADSHVEAGHEDIDPESGVVALTPDQAAAAGVSIVALQRGGGAELKLPGRVAFAPGAEAAVDAPLAGAVARVHVGLGDRVA
ncbi:MAG: efflux RND transporter periplasmic adaptor subunit, partial [Brevundimonas sp.]